MAGRLPHVTQAGSRNHSNPLSIGSMFTVDDKYDFIKRIGYGAYGVVCSAHDKVSNSKVAIKKIPKAFQDLVDAKRVLREIKILSKYEHKT
jgi:serine/threonine protein kinase